MSGVSRETTEAPPVPEQAQGVFGSRLPVVAQYAELLAGAGVVRGLIGPRERDRLWDRHLLNCGVLAELVPEGSSVADIGSGAGLPGLVLALARPDAQVTLIEPLLRRTTFLEEAVSSLRLDNVRVLRGRAEALHGSESFDVVTSRAVAPLGRLLEWSMPLVSPSGMLLALKGSSASEEVQEADAVIARLGCAEPVIDLIGGGVLDEPTRVVRVVWADPTRVRWASGAGTSGGGGSGRKKRVRRR